MLYDKKILAQTEVYLNGDFCEVYCLDGGEYFDIHILNDSFASDELNTLRLQEPKEIQEATSEIFLTCQGVEFLLWHRFYGKGGKMHSFNCELVESVELLTIKKDQMKC